MTIDKFGRHIHKHIVRRHLMEEDVVADFVKHPKFKKELEIHVRDAARATPTSRYVVRMDGSGFIGIAGYYHISAGHVTQNYLYENKLYSGKVVNVHYSNPKLTKLYIDSKPFDPKKPPIVLKDGMKFRLKYLGGKPYLITINPEFVEVVIEGNVIN